MHNSAFMVSNVLFLEFRVTTINLVNFFVKAFMIFIIKRYSECGCVTNMLTEKTKVGITVKNL